MQKQQLLKKMEESWSALLESISDLTDEQLLLPGVTGEWSVKDILAHVTTWEEESLKHLPTILAGGRTERYSVVYGGLDAFNAIMAEKKHGLPVAEVRRQMADTHSRLVDYLLALPEQDFQHESRFRRRLRLDTYSHYPIHTLAIRTWRTQMGPPPA